MKWLLVCFAFTLGTMVTMAQYKTNKWLNNLLRKNASEKLLMVLNNPQVYHYQLIYTKIDRDKNNLPHFKNYYLNVDKHCYFNPASMVKMPVALASLEKVNNLHIKGIDKNTTMLTDSSFSGQTPVLTDTTSPTGYPSIAHYIKKIFVVSDNDAYNRLYEFCGQQYLNECLWSKGYKDVRITRRFVKMTAEENRHTNSIKFMDKDRLIYQQPAAYSKVRFDFSKKILLGHAHYDRDNQLVNQPMDFSAHNNAPLEDLQQMLQSVLFPSSVPANMRFHLTKDDYTMLYQYMSQIPSESQYPKYDRTEFFDSYTKFFFFTSGKQKIPPYIRSFNKTGWSYGFLTDVCYIVDFKNNVEFMLSGNIYVNSDGVLNDDKYDYEDIGLPFFKEVGEKIYDYELHRKRSVTPNLDAWHFRYN